MSTRTLVFTLTSIVLLALVMVEFVLLYSVHADLHEAKRQNVSLSEEIKAIQELSDSKKEVSRKGIHAFSVGVIREGELNDEFPLETELLRQFFQQQSTGVCKSFGSVFSEDERHQLVPGGVSLEQLLGKDVREEVNRVFSNEIVGQDVLHALEEMQELSKKRDASTRVATVPVADIRDEIFYATCHFEDSTYILSYVPLMGDRIRLLTHVGTEERKAPFLWPFRMTPVVHGQSDTRLVQTEFGLFHFQLKERNDRQSWKAYHIDVDSGDTSLVEDCEEQHMIKEDTEATYFSSQCVRVLLHDES